MNLFSPFVNLRYKPVKYFRDYIADLEPYINKLSCVGLVKTNGMHVQSLSMFVIYKNIFAGSLVALKAVEDSEGI